MFIIERYLALRQEKIARWESDYKKWLSGRASYYNKRDYEYEHPYPVVKPKHLLELALWTVAGTVVVSGVGMLIIWNAGKPKNLDKTDVAQTAQETQCGEKNRTDTYVIVYGDYQGVQGKVVGGCGVDEDYRFQIAEGQRKALPNDGVDGEVDLSNRVIFVNNSDNLEKINIPTATPEASTQQPQ